MSPTNFGKQVNALDYGRPASPRAEVDRLIEAHVSYSHAIAGEVTRKLPPDVDKKDIQGWAELGLVEAANSFDHSRGVQFKTFAYYRIKGAIYDGLRKMGWYSKGLYHQMRFEMHANEYLQDLSSETPPPGSPESQLQDMKGVTANLISCYMLSLETMPQEPEDQSKVSAEEQALRNQQSRNLRTSLAQLPETNRRVLEYCYFQGLTLEETGRKMGLSKSWVCRLHAKSLELLRQQLTRLTAMRVQPRPATFPGLVR
ncbi:MAG TPA: sigma-70 family RNA polymerase sigma factor [Candidatus Acidoferrum sp.]|jgi:RNA polymerase sigma factor FliA|nr:sigma-70 family RNA polymerase sigma factor [Candidatus Acidoferrum sp.]